MAPASRRIGTALLGLSAFAVVGILPVTPAQAEPDVKEVKKTVERLYHEAEAAQEKVHDARLELRDLRRDLRALRADESRQDARLAQVRQGVADSVVAQLEGQTISSVGQVAVSEDPAAFLEQMATMAAFNELQSAQFADYGVELDKLDLRRTATAERTAQIDAQRAELATQSGVIDARLAEAKEELAELEAEARARLMASTGSTAEVPSDIPASGRAARAIAYALAQVGDTYVFGAAGENAFDCSGLTMRAWGTAGVSLPHSSSAQFSSGPRVSEGDLQPGDLVFYYSPISHVGIYLGNGAIVHAANPGTGVVVSGLHSMPYVGAVRPG